VAAQIRTGGKVKRAGPEPAIMLSKESGKLAKRTHQLLTQRFDELRMELPFAGARMLFE
jgi:hypothetical protein